MNPTHARFHSHNTANRRRLSVVWMLGAYTLALLMGITLLGLSIVPEQAYAHPPRLQTAQDAPPTEEEAQPAPEPIEPALAPVQIDLSAVISGNLIVYTLYATNVTEQALWDLTIDVPLPEGTILLSAQSSPAFVADHQNGVVSFYTPNLPPNASSGPQRIRALAPVDDDFLISTYAEASWKFIDSIMRQSSVFQAAARTSTVSAYPGATRLTVADMAGEVPLGHVDFTGVTIQSEGSIFRIDFHLAGPLGPVGETAEYFLYIDSDCNEATGRVRDTLGSEYRVRYRHARGAADLNTWAVAADGSGQWLSSGSIAVNSPIGGHTITIWIPSVLMDTPSRLCWRAESEHRVSGDAPRLPKDFIPNGRIELGFTQFGGWDELQVGQSTLLITSTVPAEGEPDAGGPTVQPLRPVSSPSQPTGKLAIPLTNAQGSQDIHIFSVPDGELLQQIPNADQPAFRADGTSVLGTRTTDDALRIYQFSLDDGGETPIGAASITAYASYDLQGTQMVYEEWQSALDSSSALSPSAQAMDSVVLMQCNLAAAPDGGNCQEPANLQALISLNMPSVVHGANPLWAAGDQVIYRGCPSWSGIEQCGIYASMIAAADFGEPSFPTLLDPHPAAFPNDAKDDFFTMTAQQGEDWEVYAASVDGTWLVNVSRDRDAQDGLSAISPDGNWVAFVSNREGEWAVWISPLNGGRVQKLLDLPGSGAWADDANEWVRQRLSWGP